MTTVGAMRSVFAKATFLIASIALVFFCSCERHHPAELPAEPANSESAEHVPGSNGPGEHAVIPAAAVTPTPAKFFPDNSPH